MLWPLFKQQCQEDNRSRLGSLPLAPDFTCIRIDAENNESRHVLMSATFPIPLNFRC